MISNDRAEAIKEQVEELVREHNRLAKENKRLRGAINEHLNNLAARCHTLAAARGKYRRWNTGIGRQQLAEELDEWHRDVEGCKLRIVPDHGGIGADEFGDIIHAVLSVGHHMGYDVVECLADAMDRNERRAREGA